jgi:KDO2-lipid IV(A) lauroyltransferase
MPAPLWRAVARRIGLLASLFVGGRRRVLVVNAGYLAPQLALHERKRMARRTFINFFEAASDLFRLPSQDADEIQEMISAEGMEHLRAAQALGRGVIVVTPHLGPYELGGAYVASLGLPVHAMVEDIDPETNAALASYRGAAGMGLISRSTGLRQMYRLLKEGQIVLLVADRVIGEGAEGIEVAWGAGRRPIPSGPAAFALATGAPIVPGYIVRRPAGSPTRYLLHLDDPIVATGKSRDDVTRDVAARLADAVCQHPDQWYVFQPDWRPRDASA